MYSTIQQFIDEWNHESQITQAVLDALTDDSLDQSVSPDDRTLGEIAWHIVTSDYSILSFTGLELQSPGDQKTVPAASEIAEAYRRFSQSVAPAAAKQLTDDSLQQTCEVYGMTWLVGQTLSMVLKHMIHHRGQLTVLMRQANLSVPDIYGPARKA